MLTQIETPNMVRARSRAASSARLSAALVSLIVFPTACFQARQISAPAPTVDVATASDAEPSATAAAAVNEVGTGEQSALPVAEHEHQRQAEAAEPGVVTPAKHPLDGLSAQEITERLKSAPEALGPMSIGNPNGGALFNAIQMPEDPRWERVDAAHAWGTRETIDYIVAAIQSVHEQFDDTPPLAIGHISGRQGGPLQPHRSHQSGRDVDLGFYYHPDAHQWYRRGTKDTLDLPRTWALVRALITEADVRLILVDHSIQRLLRQYAESIGENEVWLQDVFEGAGYSRPALIRHAPGHATHLHVRFYNPMAQETARRCYAPLVALGKVKPPVHYVQHRVRKGDTLIGLAKRYGTTVRAIKRANGLRSNLIMAKRTYKIPRTGPAAAQPMVAIPPRRLPPLHADAKGSVSHYRDQTP